MCGTLRDDTLCPRRICTTTTWCYWSVPADLASSTFFRTSPVLQGAILGSPCISWAPGRMPRSGWCAVSPPSSLWSCIPPVAWPLWPPGSFWPDPAMLAQKLSRSESMFRRYRHLWASCSGMPSWVLCMPGIVPLLSFCCNQTWPAARSAPRLSQRNLPSKRCSLRWIPFLSCFLPTVPYLRFFTSNLPIFLGVRLLVRVIPSFMLRQPVSVGMAMPLRQWMQPVRPCCYQWK